MSNKRSNWSLTSSRTPGGLRDTILGEASLKKDKTLKKAKYGPSQGGHRETPHEEEGEPPAPWLKPDNLKSPEQIEREKLILNRADQIIQDNKEKVILISAEQTRRHDFWTLMENLVRICENSKQSYDNLFEEFENNKLLKIRSDAARRAGAGRGDDVQVSPAQSAAQRAIKAAGDYKEDRLKSVTIRNQQLADNNKKLNEETRILRKTAAAEKETNEHLNHENKLMSDKLAQTMQQNDELNAEVEDLLRKIKEVNDSKKQSDSNLNDIQMLLQKKDLEIEDMRRREMPNIEHPSSNNAEQSEDGNDETTVTKAKTPNILKRGLAVTLHSKHQKTIHEQEEEIARLKSIIELNRRHGEEKTYHEHTAPEARIDGQQSDNREANHQASTSSNELNVEHLLQDHDAAIEKLREQHKQELDGLKLSLKLSFEEKEEQLKRSHQQQQKDLKAELEEKRLRDLKDEKARLQSRETLSLWRRVAQWAKEKAHYEEREVRAQKNLDEAREQQKKEVEKHRGELLQREGHWRQESARLQSDHQIALQSRDQLRNEDQIAHQAALNRQKANHDKAHKELNDSFAIERRELGATIDKHERDIISTKASMKRQLEESAQKLKDQEKEATKEIARQLKAADGKHTEAIAAIRQEMATKAEEHAKEIQELKDDYDTEIARLEASLFNIKQQHQSELKRIDDQQRKETASLRAERNEFYSRLLKREPILGLDDGAIANKFTVLVRDVAAFARHNWNGEQKIWTSGLIAKLGENERRAKWLIMQDSFWMLLYNGIFCSPFRLFGEPGKELEMRWIEEWPRDKDFDTGSYMWPTPSIDSEEFRWENAESGLKALTRKTADYQPRARLRIGFMEYKQELAERVVIELGEFIKVDKAIQKQIEDLISKSVKMWLEFCSQRCRLLVVLAGNSQLSSTERAKLSGSVEGLKVTVKPELQRYGNSNGTDLAEMNVVGKCEQDAVVLALKK